MASVLAIVSKALFDKMVPEDIALGAVVDTNQYVSANKTFDGIDAGDGDAIFLVTVRPPSEKLWLVAILEKPKKKGTKWVSASNAAPLTDITAAIKKLVFESGTGLKAKKGALGMSLQTPRALTPADVKLIRGLVPKVRASAAKTPTKKVSANAAYMKAVEAAVGKPKKVAPSSLGAMRLENKRMPFHGKLSDLKPATRKQLAEVLGRDIAKLFVADPDDEMRDVEIADIVDAKSGKPRYELMLWPYGDGVIVHAGKTKVVSNICQHGLDPVEDLGKRGSPTSPRLGSKAPSAWAYRRATSTSTTTSSAKPMTMTTTSERADR